MLEYIRQRNQKKLFGSRKNRLYYLSLLATALLVFTVVGVLFVGILFLWYAKDLPRPDKVRRLEGLSTVILDRNNKKLYDIYEDENRIPVKLADIPKYLREATIAIEDKQFYKHQGLSSTGFIRAMVNIFVYRNLQGGSTLTQQLVKTVLLTSERTLPRKIKEAILSLQIERKYSKDEILQMYLNEVPYGGTAVGVESAAQYYFGKPVRELGLTESAFIAGLPQSPSAYSPFTGSEEAYIWRTEQVLRRMREDGYISKTQEKESAQRVRNLQFASSTGSLKAPHFVEYVKKLLIDEFGADRVDAGGLQVVTTLDWDLQEKAQEIVATEVDKVRKLKVSNGAAVVIDPNTGEILAMVGSRDYMATDSAGLKFNVVTQGLRQPGSAIKPITYATALKKGYTASTLLMDVETKYPSGVEGEPEYNPKNYDLKYHGPTQMRFALGNSINTIAVKLSALVGVQEVLETAYDMGIDSLEPTRENLSRLGLSLTLGGGEVTLLDLTSAYGAFAAGGLSQPTFAISKVTDVNGKVIYEHKSVKPKQVLPAEVAYIISHMLSDNEARKLVFGTRSYLVVPGRTVAVKTGTTDDKRDNWTVGYTSSRAVGVWVGNNDNSPMNPSLASGVTGAAPIWNQLIKAAVEELPEEPFKRPDNVIEMEIDAFGGGLPVEGQPTRSEVYVKGTEPTGPAPIYQKIKISIHDENRLANPVEINKGEYKEKLFIVIRENDPVSPDGKNRWQEGIDAWLASQSDSKFHPPTETYREGDEIAVRLITPEDNKQYDSNDIEVKAEAAGFNDLDKIELYVDDKKLSETNDRRLQQNITLSDGSHIIKVKAIDKQGKSSERSAKIGIKQPYRENTPEPTPSAVVTPTPVAAP